NVEGSAVRWPEDRWELGLLLNYGRNLLVVGDNNNRLVQSVVNGRLGFDAIVSLTVAGPFAIGLDVPFFIAHTGDINPTFAGLGDVRLVPKIRILDDRETFGLGLVAEVRAPTHLGSAAETFAGGARNVVFWPKLVLDHQWKRTAKGLRFGINAGALIRA